jgi:histidine ammonia-lyase
MGPISVRNCARILENVEYILAIEAMCAAQGLEFIKLAPGEGVLAAYKRLRRDVRPLKGDRYMKPDLEKVRQILPEILKEVQIRIGKLE